MNPIIDPNPGPELCRLRKERGITAAHVARILGKKRSYLCQLEKAIRPWRLDLIESYRKAIGV